MRNTKPWNNFSLLKRNSKCFVQNTICIPSLIESRTLLQQLIACLNLILNTADPIKRSYFHEQRQQQIQVKTIQTNMAWPKFLMSNVLIPAWNPLCKKCLYSEWFWSVFSRIWTKYSVPLRIQFECGKLRARITPNTDTFYASLQKFSSSSSVKVLKLNIIFRWIIFDMITKTIQISTGVIKGCSMKRRILLCVNWKIKRI